MRNAKLSHRFAVLIVFCAFVVAAPHVTRAQQATTITANGTVDDPKTSFPLTLNFPPAGGAVTGSATYQGVSVMSITGSFVGGDGGEASGTFVADLQWWGTAAGSWTGNFFANGTGSGNFAYAGGSCGGGCNYTPWQAPWHVTFPAQDFQAALQNPSTGSEPAVGPACSPQVRGLSPSRPGDVISPGASYFDPQGRPVGIIQDRWFLNGVNSNSIVWDGKQVQVEVQWTCLDHSGSSQVFVIPAYQEQPAVPPAGPQPPESAPPNAGGGPGTVGIVVGAGAILAGVLGTAAATGIAITQVIKRPPTRAPVSPAPRATPRGLRPSPPNPPAAPRSAGPTPQEPSRPAQPPQKPITPEEKAQLISIRSQMEARIDELKIQWRQAREATTKLSRLKKKDMTKFILKKGWETKEWILNSPTEVINKLTLDPVLDKLVGQHDTGQDANIIVAIHNQIQGLNTEMQEATNEVKYLGGEIAKINQQLAGAGQ